MTATAFAAIHNDATAFTAILRDSLEALRLRVAAVTRCPIELLYGATEDGSEHWAALTVEALPVGSCGRPGLLVSVLAGPGVPGFAVVTSSDLRSTVCSITAQEHLETGLVVAEAEALQRFTELAEGSKSSGLRGGLKGRSGSCCVDKNSGRKVHASA